MRGEIVDPPIRAHIERDVQITDGEGRVSLIQYVLTIESALNPEVGDTLEQGGENFKLDVLIDTNGYSSRFVLLKV